MTRLLTREPSQLVKSLTQLVKTPGPHHDVMIVCRDGAMQWNSFSLGLWCGIVRTHLQEEGGVHCQDCRSPVTILLPDVRVNTLMKLLIWSNEGEVLANGDEVSEIKALLTSFGVNVGLLLQTPVLRDYSHQSSSNNCNAHVVTADYMVPCDSQPDEADEVAVASRKEREAEPFVQKATDKALVHAAVGPSDSKTFACEKTTNGAQLRVSCMLCPLKFRYFSCLKSHLSSQHFSSELIRLIGNRDRSEPCPRCGKILKIFKSWRITLLSHMGGTHNLIYKVVPLNLRQQLLRMAAKRSNATNINSAAVRKCISYFAESESSCDTCWQGFRKFSEFLMHLSNSHYGTDIKKLMEDNFTCPFCKEVVKDGTQRHRALKHHVLRYHHSMLLFIPSEGRRLLADVIDVVRPPNGDGKAALDTSYSYECTDDITPSTDDLLHQSGQLSENELSEVVREEPEDALDDNIGSVSLSCMFCTYQCVDFSTLKQHLSGAHFFSEIDKLIGIKQPSDQCPRCGIRLSAPERGAANSRSLVITHMGEMHDAIFEVVPPDIKKELLIMLSNTRNTDQEKTGAGRCFEYFAGCGGDPCMRCRRGFDRFTNFLRHLADFHYGNELRSLTGDYVTCPYCGRHFDEGCEPMRNLRYHLVRHHHEQLSFVPA